MSHKHNKQGRSSADEHWTKLIRHTMQEPAWRALSSTAQALYPWLKLEWRGPDANNNGRISLSVRQAAAAMGVRPDTAAEGFRDLQRKGFIVQIKPAYLGTEGAAKSPEYELTELKMPAAERDGRKLYREWSPGKDFPVVVTGANNPAGNNGRRKTEPCHENHDGPVTQTVTKRGGLVTKTVTRRHENRDESAVLADQTVTESVTTLSYHTKRRKASASPEREAAPQPARSGDMRPDWRAQLEAGFRSAAKPFPSDEFTNTIDHDTAEVRRGTA